MKRIAIAGFVVLASAVLFVFLYAHSLSIDRALLIASANELWEAERQLQQNGVLTNRVRVQTFTNQVTVGTTVFQCVLVATAPQLEDAGSLVASTDGTFIWIDKKTGPLVFRDKDGNTVFPRRFKSLWYYAYSRNRPH